MKRLDAALARVSEFVPGENEEIRQLFETLREKLEEVNKDSVMANINIGYHTVEKLDLSKVHDYEVLTLDEEENLDEIYWNIIYRFNEDEVDIELAKECGLVVVSVDGERYLALGGVGMDFKPQLISYVALRYGFISEEDCYYFSSHARRDYFKYVVGNEVYERVLKRLGIYDLVEEEEK